MERGVFMAPYKVDVGGDDPGSGLQGGIDVGRIFPVSLVFDN